MNFGSYKTWQISFRRHYSFSLWPCKISKTLTFLLILAFSGGLEKTLMVDLSGNIYFEPATVKSTTLTVFVADMQDFGNEPLFFFWACNTLRTTNIKTAWKRVALTILPHMGRYTYQHCRENTSHVGHKISMAVKNDVTITGLVWTGCNCNWIVWSHLIRTVWIRLLKGIN